MQRTLFEPEHEAFREAFRAFVAQEITPHYPAWEQAGIVPRELWRKAGEMGFLGFPVPEAYGGLGLEDYRYAVVITEELVRAATNSVFFGLHTDVCVPYLVRYGTDEQKQRWLPGSVSGALITAIAMSEPAAGSDLAGIQATARREGEHYVLNGQKTFISNGLLADLVIVVAKTDPAAGARGVSLFVVEAGMEGFSRGRRLEKLGLHAQDTAELYFHDVRLPVANRLGEEGAGFRMLMEQLPQERLGIAVGGVATAEAALEWTIQYVKERRAFGQAVADFQTVRFALAEMQTETLIGRTFLDRCVVALNAGELTTEEASMAKWWCSELGFRVADRCLQLHGGYGYMTEYAVARTWADARVGLIYGGTNEIMKEIIGRAIVR
jgi:alkylation response protein AidB-like acyl-CoA dehydrogenase